MAQNLVEIASYRKQLLARQTELRRLLEDPTAFEPGRQLFMLQHGMLHSGHVSQPPAWSYEDALLDDLTAESFRCLLPKEDHSIAWLVWHTTRCEDITMNMLIAGEPQVLHSGRYLSQMQVPNADTGNAMLREEIAEFSQCVDLPALRAYRLAVGQRTRQIVRTLQPAQLKQKVEPARIQKVLDDGAVLPAAAGIARYWAGRSFAGLLLMPATRHHLSHLNEILEIKKKLQ